MEESVLTSTKKVLGLAKEYTAFDEDILMHINSAFSVLQQLGVGPDEGIFVEDDGNTWDEITSDLNALHMVRSYIFLKVQLLFDPPNTSFVLDAKQNQIKEMEWRISTVREWNLHPVDPREEVIVVENY